MTWASIAKKKSSSGSHSVFPMNAVQPKTSPPTISG